LLTGQLVFDQLFVRAGRLYRQQVGEEPGSAQLPYFDEWLFDCMDRVLGCADGLAVIAGGSVTVVARNTCGLLLSDVHKVPGVHAWTIGRCPLDYYEASVHSSEPV